MAKRVFICFLYLADSFAFSSGIETTSKGAIDDTRIKLQRLIPDIADIGNSIDNNGVKTDLWIVGTYIAAHKYFGADFRYLKGDVGPDDQVFYKQFPSPRLRDLHPDLSNVCSSSAMQCVEAILSNAKKSGTLQHLMKSMEHLESYAPFQNNYEDFKYRQTAMYFLCWHAQLRDSFLEFDVGQKSCLAHLNAVDEIPVSTRERLLKNNAAAIKDIRDSAFKNDKFTCAHLWFCPDPCYGRKNGGNFEKRDFKVQGNPCLELKNSECKWKVGENKNFQDLIRNKINITCNCESERAGFHWNSRFDFCVDTDECYERNFSCPDNRICKNTVGSYVCTCQRGYDVNKESDECERLLTLHQSAIILEHVYFEPEETPNENDFILEIMDLIGLSESETLKATSLSFVLGFLVILDFTF